MKKIIIGVIMILIVIALGVVVHIDKNGQRKNNVIIVNEETTSDFNKNKGEGITNNEDSDGKLTIVFGGDVLLSESMINVYNRNGGNVENIMGKGLLKEFKQADIAMFNQEFPFSLRGTKMENKQYTFRTDPKYVKVLTELGIDVVSLANNHILDYGEEALLDTLDTLSNTAITYGGAGRNIEEAKEVKYIEKENKKVAFICPSRVIPVSEWSATADRPGLLTTYDPNMTLEQIKIAESNADYTVVYVHWGLEHKEMPEDYQKTMAKQYIDAGADVVMGCHTHCLQGIEIYNGKPIVYSLGNFLFGGNIDRTMMVKVELGDEITTQLKPCKAVSYNTELVTEADKIESFYEYYKGISFGVDIDSEGYVK